MKSTLVLASAFLLTSSAMAGHPGDDAPHWGYSGEHGPDHWGGLCSSGKNQSPVDISGAVAAQLVPLTFKYDSHATEVLNNGHTVQVSYAPSSVLAVGSHAYELKQFHFHAPSENLLEGRRFPLEVHFVHADSEGNLAVVAVLFEEGAANAGLEKFWKKLPEHAGDKHALSAKLAAVDLMPAVRDYYRFSGSLTTPPCSEGVNWLVMKHPLTASAKQIEKVAAAMGHSNARPVQPLNARVIVK